MSTNQIEQPIATAETSTNIDLVQFPWLRTETLELMQKNEAKMQQNEAKRQQLWQKVKQLKTEAAKFRENVREHGKALDKTIEKQEAAFAKKAAKTKEMEDRMSRVETISVFALTAMVVNEAARGDPFDSGDQSSRPRQ